MPAVTLNTRTDLNTSKAKLGTFELTTTTTVLIWYLLGARRSLVALTRRASHVEQRNREKATIIYDTYLARIFKMIPTAQAPTPAESSTTAVGENAGKKDE